jgi:hypothetical protein
MKERAQRAPVQDEEEEEEKEKEKEKGDGGKKKPNSSLQEGYIIRGRMGIVMPERNAFDFTERPKETVE